MFKPIVRFKPPVNVGKISYVLSVRPIVVELERAICVRDLARECRIKRMNKRITDELFPLVHEFPSAEYYLIYFANSELSGKKILELVYNLGFEPASIRETLSFYLGLSRKKRKELLSRSDLVALGSEWRPAKNRPTRVPFINGKRHLVLSHESCFSHGDIFLIRKIS